MAYAYARRTAAAGLYLQRIWDREHYDYSLSMFKKFQMITGHTKEFQIKAAQQAIELLESYDPRLNHELTSAMVMLAENNHQWPIEGYINHDVLLTILDNTISERTIESDIVDELTNGVNTRIKVKEVALQFVLEELEAASQGNEIARKFVHDSGFSPSEYEGAMENSLEEVEGINGPQQFLLSSLKPYVSNMDFTLDLRLSIVKNIIDEWDLLNEYDRIQKLMRSLKNILEDDKGVMPVLAPNIPVPVVAKPNHIYFTEKNISLAKGILGSLRELTGNDVESIIIHSLKQS